MDSKVKTIKLLQRLNVFKEADTSSEVAGQLEAGDYELSQAKKNHPDTDSDYAQVLNPDNGQLAWICSRYQDKVYARVLSSASDSAQSFDFENDDHAIDEKALVDLFPDFNDFTYDLKSPTYPFSIKGCNVPQAPPHQNNCCTFVEALLVKAWENSFPDFSWDNKKHGQMMIFSADDYFSPITCLVEQNMAVAIKNADQAPSPWTAIQGWRKQWGGGHTFIILDYHEETDRVLTLESNDSQYYHLNGVGYRMIGNMADHPHPTTTWWENESLWTWEKVKAAYPFREQAKLKVKNVEWV